MIHILSFSNKEYNKIIKQTVDSYNKAQAELKLEQDIRKIKSSSN